jgi:D-alanyl-D-alanine carboxypeptidase (penicillin-binding protein 5/6)
MSRTEDSIRLLTYGFRFFETHKLYPGNAPLFTARVWKGKAKEVGLGLSKDMYLTLRAGQYKNLQTTFQVGELKAPITKNQSYGTLVVSLNNQVLATEPLIALSDNRKAGMFRSMADAIHFSFHKLFSKSNEKANNG